MRRTNHQVAVRAEAARGLRSLHFHDARAARRSAAPTSPRDYRHVHRHPGGGGGGRRGGGAVVTAGAGHAARAVAGGDGESEESAAVGRRVWLRHMHHALRGAALAHGGALRGTGLLLELAAAAAAPPSDEHFVNAAKLRELLRLPEPAAAAGAGAAAAGAGAGAGVGAGRRTPRVWVAKETGDNSEARGGVTPAAGTSSGGGSERCEVAGGAAGGEKVSAMPAACAPNPSSPWASHRHDPRHSDQAYQVGSVVWVPPRYHEQLGGAPTVLPTAKVTPRTASPPRPRGAGRLAGWLAGEWRASWP
jgi:hypothetical protein